MASRTTGRALDQRSYRTLNEKQYTTIPLESLLDIAERLGVLLELTTSQGPASAE